MAKYITFTFEWCACSIVFVVIRVVGMTGLVNDSIKTVFLVGCVFDGSQGTIGIMHAVRSLHDVTVPILVCGFVIASMWILYAILIRVFRVSLRTPHDQSCYQIKRTVTILINLIKVVNEKCNTYIV